MQTQSPSNELSAMHQALQESASRIDIDPKTNSVFDLARQLFLKLQAGESDLPALESIVDEVHLLLAEQRAAAFREQHDGGNSEASWTRLRERLSELAQQGFDVFREAVEASVGGIVFTAHPTFALSDTARLALAQHAEAPSVATRKALAEHLSADGRDWSQSISLTGEHDEVQAVIAQAQRAMQTYIETILSVARKSFPDRWRSVRPSAPTLASWVGYDLDGRTDIDWWQSVSLRLSEKAEQLSRYATLCESLPALGDLTGKLERAATICRRDAILFAADLSDPDKLVEAAQALATPDPDRLTDASEIIDVIDAHMADADEDTAARLSALRSLVDALQLGTARIHLRVNAAQVRAVISRDLGLETEDRDLGRLALQQLSDKAAQKGTLKVDFRELFLERSTARRQVMMCAVWLTYIDSGSPIRFLIAEAENPATVMGILYLARQYGIDEKIDISPLFETPEALETGGRFISRLLDEEAFRSYLDGRGYLSIQLGFSDAGRFIGQVAADMAIERIHNLIMQSLAEKAPGPGLLIFNTHGESFGRGAYPGSFQQRFDHVLSCWTRTRARQLDVSLRHEVSFQGGDGFLHFATPGLAEITYAAYCEHLLSDPDDCLGDPFYTERDFTWDTYRSLRAWHERLFNDPDYGRLLSDFATNFLVRAGSRQRRRSGGSKGPRSLRAISHNATLQQLGAPVNTACGLGSAIRRETERLIELLNRSPRMRSLLHLALHARMLTSAPAMRAYAEVYDPSFWVAVARKAAPDDAVAYRRVYYTLRDAETFQSIRRVADRISIDLGKFDRLLAEIEDAPSPEQRHAMRMDLHVLHALRQALMLQALSISGQLPTLSGRHDLSLGEFMQLVAEMRLGEAAAQLEVAFPKSSANVERLSVLSPEGAPPSQAGYDRLHEQIITPLKDIDRLMHKLTLAVSQIYRAFG